MAQAPGKMQAIKITLTLFAVLGAAALALSHAFYTEAMLDPFFGLALASVVILHFRVRPSWMDAVVVLAGTLALAVVDFRLLGYPARIMAWFSFLGLSSFVVLAVRSTWSSERKLLLYAWVPAALFVASDYLASNMLAWTGAAHPKTLDLYLLSFDGSLRIQLAFVVGRAYATLPWLHNTSLLAYVGLAIPIALVYAGRLVRNKERALPVMLAFLITGPVGILFYNVFPACGPHYLFKHAFPFRQLPTADFSRLVLEPILIGGPRNAMPSLHLTWTLLAWWYSRGLSWGERFCAFVFLAFTAVATLGTGEHWFGDLVVAFPFALMIQAICAYTVSWRDRRRLEALGFGLAATFIWLVLLRYGPGLFWTSPAVPWALCAATIALTGIRQLKLANLDGLNDAAPVHEDAGTAGIFDRIRCHFQPTTRQAS